VFLVLKCCSSVVYGAARIAVDVLQLSGDLGASPPWLNFIYGNAVGVNMHLSWAYTVERVLATCYMKTYESQRPRFGYAVSAYIILMTIGVVWHETITNRGEISVTAAIADFAFQGFSLLCVGVVVFLWFYNRRRYKLSSSYSSAISLTERYQNSENCRTTAQLTPLIILHVLSMLCTGSLFIAAVVDMSEETTFLHQTLVNLTNCFIYILCQIAVLYFHEGVRSRAVSKISRAWKAARLRLQPKRVTQASESIDEGSTYFKMLSAEWDQKFLFGIPIGINSHLSWAYTSERLLATVCMRTYEKQRPWFSIILSVFVNSENIRTTRQLTPLIILHVLSMLCIGTTFVAALLRLRPDAQLLHATLVNLLNCLLYIGCQLAVLYFHSDIRKRAKSTLSLPCGYLCSYKVAQQLPGNTVADTAVHFRTLEAEWNATNDERHALEHGVVRGPTNISAV
ncbi:CRE-SRE-18 protein, partial [Aphelenchoides avenae]